MPSRPLPFPRLLPAPCSLPRPELAPCPRPLLLPLPLPASLQQPPSSSKSSSFSSSTFSMTTGTVFLGDLDLVVLVLAPKGFSEVLFLSLLLPSWFSVVAACEEEVFPFL